jgi:hypothetical protein
MCQEFNVRAFPVPVPLPLPRARHRRDTAQPMDFVSALQVLPQLRARCTASYWVLDTIERGTAPSPNGPTAPRLRPRTGQTVKCRNVL